MAGTDSVNLHIFAEEETIGDRTPQHALESFAKMTRELSGLDIQLTAPKDIPSFDLTKDKLPADAHPLEADDLSSRQTRLALFGRNLRDAHRQFRNPKTYRYTAVPICSFSGGK